MLSLDILALLHGSFIIWGMFTKKILGGGARILKHSRVVLTIYDMVFGLLFSKVGRGRVI